MLTTTVRPRSRALTTLARIWTELRITTADPLRDELIESLILEASDMIIKEIGYELFRARVTETVVGYGRSELLLSRTPIAKLESVSIDGEVIDTSLFTVDAIVGMLLHRGAWANTRHIGVALTPFERPDEGEHRIVADYWAGVFGPGEDINASGLSVYGPTETFVVDDPPLLVPGDVIETVGFAEDANNGVFNVVERNASGIVVDGMIITEASAPAAARIKVRTLDRALERFCVQAVKSWIVGSDHDPAVTSERIGDWAATYGTSNKDLAHELPPGVLKGLDKFRRYV